MLADAKAEEELYLKLGMELPPDAQKRARPDSEDAAPSGAPLTVTQSAPARDIRFRLQSLDASAPAMDRKFIFNAPRSAMLKKVVPFLRQWLAEHGYGNGKVCAVCGWRLRS